MELIEALGVLASVPWGFGVLGNGVSPAVTTSAKDDIIAKQTVGWLGFTSEMLLSRKEVIVC